MCAFHFEYDWSHAIATAETAVQTRELTGWDTGIGIYINYAFAICLLIDLIIQANHKVDHGGRKFINGLVIFMIINGAIVFGTSHSRIAGGICLGYLAVIGVKSRAARR